MVESCRHPSPNDNTSSCTLIFTAELFIISKNWKQPDAHQLTDGDMFCIHDGVLHSYKDEILLSSTTWRDPKEKGVMLNEISQGEKDKHQTSHNSTRVIQREAKQTKELNKTDINLLLIYKAN